MNAASFAPRTLLAFVVCLVVAALSAPAFAQARPPAAAAPPGAIPPPPQVIAPPPVNFPPGGKFTIQIAPAYHNCMKQMGAALAWDHRYVDKIGRQRIPLGSPPLGLGNRTVQMVINDLKLFAASTEAWVTDGMRGCSRELAKIISSENLTGADRYRLINAFVEGYKRFWE